MTKICNIQPTRAIVGYSRELIFVKPCGVKYTEKHEVHCKRFEERDCEYMALKHINQQQIEEYLLKDLGE